jgi:Undecaprenyl-phosphate glucose phosphotransferase
MIKENQRFLNIFNAVSDGCLTFAAYLLAAMVRFDILEGGIAASTFMMTPEYLAVAAGYSVLIIFVYAGFHLYGSHRFKQVAQEIGLIFAINSIGTLTMMAVLFLLHLMDFSRLALLFFFFFSTILVVGKRIAMRGVLRHYRMLGYNQKHVVVVGNGHLAHNYIRTILSERSYGFTLDGYVSRQEKPELGKQLGAYEALNEILEKYRPDEVVVALEPHESQMMSTIISACEKQGVRTSIIPYYNDYLPAHPYVETIGNNKLMNIRTIPLDNLGNALLKRAFDITASLLLIVLTSPIMLVVAVGVKLTSPGPILFRQERVGLNKKTFKMLKFRSMRVDTDHQGWTTEDDPRKTRFGSFIRKCSLDEFPQFFNVLRGDMSLIGPRPELPHFVEQFKEEIPLYLVRQQVRPGITGWAQVNGLRGDTSIVERVKADIWYIENWTWLLDMKILFRTVFGGMINQEKVGKENPREETI